MRKADLRSEQNDTSGRGARAQNIRQLESKQNHSSSILFYNIIIHFNRRSVSISPLTCLFYRREVSFIIHQKILLVYITLFQLSALFSVVYLVCKSKQVMCAIKLQFFPQVEPLKIGKDGLSSVLLETLHISEVT